MLLKKLKALTVMAFAMIMVAGAVFVINTSEVNAEVDSTMPYTKVEFCTDSSTFIEMNDIIVEPEAVTVPANYGDAAGTKINLYKVVVPAYPSNASSSYTLKITFDKNYYYYGTTYPDGVLNDTGSGTIDFSPDDATNIAKMNIDRDRNGIPDLHIIDEMYDEEYVEGPKMFAVTFTTQAERTQELLNAAGDAEQLRTDLAKANLDLDDAIKELTQVKGDLTQALTDKETAETALKQAQGNAVTTLGKVSLKSAKGAKKKVTVKWKKTAGAAGYEVIVAKNKAGTKNASIYTIKKASTVTKTVKGLAKGKYFVKVRAYKTYKGNTLYGAFSAAKKVTVK